MDRAREHIVDPFEPLAAGADDSFEALTRRRPAAASPPESPPGAVCVGVLRGFDLLERPLVAGIPGSQHELVPARSTVALRHAMIGADVMLTSHNGDWGRPIILGVVLDDPSSPAPPRAEASAPAVQLDGERLVLEAQREVVLKCGDASITLTRAGKVLIKGRYILSRSSGYNKIKGAAIDIN
jgi:hypothetical protein